MFWRFSEPGHPANRDAPWDPEWEHVIEDHYRRCDEIVGDALAASDPETLFLVLSDHGFTSFQRKFHLNYWLHEAGYLTLKNGTEPGPEAGDLLESVDWGRTRAYAVGLTGLYLNLQGREAEGIVPPSEAQGLRKEIAGALGGLKDEERGQVAIRRAHSRDAIYAGAYLDEAPDVVLACSPGYRISSATAMGGMGAGCITDNTRRWSGDHAVDPEAVPGILFSNVPLSSASPHIRDMAPTILTALGAPEEKTHEGGALIS
jgi:predicted AlkP superfamily phosphohydrolase/phosphomutase